MNRKREEKVQKLLARSRYHSSWKKTVGILSVLAVIITVAALELPAVTMEKTPQCGIQEHEHGEECYQIEKTLICDQEEVPEHHHTDECYKTTKKLICTLPEHHHTDACYEQADTTADVETQADWDASVANVVLTGKWNEDILSIALSQSGYKESEKNFIWDADDSKMGYTRYGAWYGDTYGHWCAMFVSYCMHYAGIPAAQVPTEANCQRWIELLREKEFYTEGLDAVPEPGDIIFFDYEQDAVSDHVGIVAEVKTADNDTIQSITTIEGNNGDSVQKSTYKGSDLASITGFCSISTVQKKIEDGDTVQLQYKDEKLSAQLTLNGLTQSLPDSAELTVTTMLGEDEEGLYEKTLSEVSTKINDESKMLSSFNMFDFKITDNGEPVTIDDSAKADIEVTFNSSLFRPEEMKEQSEIQMFVVDKSEETQEEILPGSETLGTTKGMEDGVTSLTVSTNGLAPLVVTLTNKTVKGTYWKLIRSESELKPNKTYAVVSAQGNYALSNTRKIQSKPNYKHVVLRPVKGNPDYYKIDKITNEEKWTYSTNTFSQSDYYLNPYYSDVLSTYYYSYPLWIRPAESNACWSVSTDVGNGRYYLNNASGNFYGSTSVLGLSGTSNRYYARTSDMLILEEVKATLTIPDDPEKPEGSLQPGSQQKPSYDPYIEVSGEKTGSYETADGITVTYASDPATSQLESQFGNHAVLKGKTDFEAQKVDNGKALTDKSVIYGADDYGAFENYEEGTFGVTLSALGQVHDTKTEEVKIPLDVLLVLDMSNSMNESDTQGGPSRAANLVDGINEAITNIMNMHPENRVCAVGYNSNADVFMDLGRYTPNRAGHYFEYNAGYGRVSFVGGKTKTMNCENGTYTQLGIALGEQVLTNHNDTTYTTTIGGESVTLPRKPVIILVSDGEPTHCTNHYMDVLNAPYYGDGGAGSYNAKGILGYYTILSANYYKSMIGIHYNLPAAMYTIAFGMDENDFSVVPGSAATSHFRATVMNPTDKNIETLGRIKTSTADDVEHQLKSLLEGSYKEDRPVDVGAYRELTLPGHPHTLVPVNEENDYKNNYAYADKAYLKQDSYDGLKSAFDEIINLNKVVTAEFGFETQADHDITITDPIGEGMEIKGDPVLRYNGINYIPADKKTSGNKTTYSYTGVVKQAPYMKKTVDLSTITVTVTTQKDGSQSVTMAVPPETLPVYTADSSTSFFYEALPVRLIYQVGVSEIGQEKIDHTPAGETCTLYTNKFGDAGQAVSSIEPTNKNTYFQGASRKWKTTTKKTSNPTDTSDHSLRVKGNAHDVVHELGNNGKLTFTKPQVSDHQLTVQKKWKDYSGQEKTEDLPAQITATLYRTYKGDNQETVTEDVVKDFVLSPENNWTKTFLSGELKEVYGREYKYYVTEKEVEGYNVSYENDGVAENTPDIPIIITNQYIYGDFILPATGGPGRWSFTAGGILLVGIAVIAGNVLRRGEFERRKK